MTEKWEARFGGYVARELRSGGVRYFEWTVWADAGIDETDCGAGTDTIVRAIAKKAKASPGDVRECWRCSGPGTTRKAKAAS